MAEPAADMTVFTVLGDAARRRSERSLGAQLLFCAVLAAGLVMVVPKWWPIAALLGASASYSAWGILTHLTERSGRHGTVMGVVRLGAGAAGMVLAVVGTVALGLGLFTGDGRSPYNACGKEAVSARCRTWANPPIVSGPIP